MAQFKYCPLIWMCHSRENNRKINRLHEGCLRIINDNKQLPFNELLEKDSSVSIHVRNLQVLATEIYRVSNELSTSIMKGIFPVNKNPYTLRCDLQFPRHLIKTVYYKTRSISKLEPKIWDLVPNNLKVIDSLEFFKQAIKKWKSENCPCQL